MKIIFYVLTLHISLIVGDRDKHKVYNHEQRRDFEYKVSIEMSDEKTPNYDYYYKPPHLTDSEHNPSFIVNLSISNINEYFDQYNEFYHFYEIDYENGKRNKTIDFEAFEENVRRCIRMNNMMRGVFFGINEFTRMTLKEFTEKYTGFDTTGIEDYKSQLFKKSKEAPLEVDWTPDPDGTPRHTDGLCKTSYVYSAMTTIEYQANRKYKGGPVPLSAQQGFNCDFEGSCKKAGTPHNVMKGLMNLGSVSRSLDYKNFQSDESVTRKTTCRVLPEPVLRIVNVTVLNVEKEEDLTAALAEYGPFATAMYVSQQVKNYCGGVLDPIDCENEPNHAVVLVGYGVTKNNIPFWLVKNSWGPFWGENGHIRLIRGKEACGIGTYLSTVDVEIINKTKMTTRNVPARKTAEKLETLLDQSKPAITNKITTTTKLLKSINLRVSSKSDVKQFTHSKPFHNFTSTALKPSRSTKKEQTHSLITKYTFKPEHTKSENVHDLKQIKNNTTLRNLSNSSINYSNSTLLKSNDTLLSSLDPDKIPIMEVVINQMKAKKRNSKTSTPVTKLTSSQRKFTIIPTTTQTIMKQYNTDSFNINDNVDPYRKTTKKELTTKSKIKDKIEDSNAIFRTFLDKTDNKDTKTREKPLMQRVTKEKDSNKASTSRETDDSDFSEEKQRPSKKSFDSLVGWLGNGDSFF